MKNFIRLKRVSWKSKNNVYLYLWNNIKFLFKSFENQIDIILIPKWYQFDTRIKQVKFIEIDNNIENIDIEMKDNILKTDNIEVNNYVWKATNYLSILWKNYDWKNIIIFNP